MPTQKSFIAEKKIARFLAKLPTEDLLALAQTLEQIEHWQANRHVQNLLSQCWSALHEGRDDPLRPLLESGDLKRDGYKHIWLTCYLYEDLWELIQIAFHHIKPELAEFEVAEDWPRDAYHLFGYVVWEISNNTFSMCLNEYQKVSLKDAEDTQRLWTRLREGKAAPGDKGKVARIAAKEPRNILLRIILSICRQKATRREPILKAKLEDFYTSLYRLNGNYVTIRRNAGSFIWLKGSKYKGSRYGGCYSEPYS